MRGGGVESQRMFMEEIRNLIGPMGLIILLLADTLCVVIFYQAASVYVLFLPLQRGLRPALPHLGHLRITIPVLVLVPLWILICHSRGGANDQGADLLWFLFLAFWVQRNTPKRINLLSLPSQMILRRHGNHRMSLAYLMFSLSHFRKGSSAAISRAIVREVQKFRCACTGEGEGGEDESGIVINQERCVASLESRVFKSR